MNKLFRSLLLRSPKTYDLIYKIKNKYFINFYLKKVHEPDFNAFKLICGDEPQLFLDIGANVGMSALSIFTLKSRGSILSSARDVPLTVTCTFSGLTLLISIFFPTLKHSTLVSSVLSVYARSFPVIMAHTKKARNKAVAFNPKLLVKNFFMVIVTILPVFPLHRYVYIFVYTL